MNYTPLTLSVIVTGVGVAVEAGLASSTPGAPGRVCYLVPGEIAWDDCECGQFVQSISSVTPTAAGPSPTTDVWRGPCGPGLIMVTVTASITRCVSGPTEQNLRAPACAMLLADAITLEIDRYTVRHAIMCYLMSLRDNYTIVNYLVGASNTVGPQGGCAGSEVTYQFAVNADCCG